MASADIPSGIRMVSKNLLWNHQSIEQPGSGSKGAMVGIVAPSSRIQSTGMQSVDPSLQALDANAADRQIQRGIIATGRNIRQRRGHTKSRLGCITCKKRKIKCQETRPFCENCIKHGSLCQYPFVYKHAHLDCVVSEVLGPCLRQQLSTPPSTLSLGDLRLFHHYMTVAFPCLPLQYDEIWTQDVPRYGQEYPYLMHAILALAGSHLTIEVETTDHSIALSHRQQAIVGLEEAFIRWPPSATEAHVMLAASYLLSFQSSYIEDAFMEHILSLRGCALLSQLIQSEGLMGPFETQKQKPIAEIHAIFPTSSRMDQDLAQEALQSLTDLDHLLAGPTAHPIEKALADSLSDSIRPHLDDEYENRDRPFKGIEESKRQSMRPFEARCTADQESPTLHPLFPMNMLNASRPLEWTSVPQNPEPPKSLRSFNALMSGLLILANWPHEAVVHLFQPSNQLGNVVMAHFCAVRFITSPLSAPKNALRILYRGMVRWAQQIVAAVEDDDAVKWTEYVRWPRNVLKCLEACLQEKRSLTFGDVLELLKDDPAAFREGRARRI